PRNLSGGIPVLVVRSFEYPFFIEDSMAGLIYAASVVIAIGNRERSRVPAHNLGELLAELLAGCARLLQKFCSDLGRNDRLRIVPYLFFLDDASLAVVDAHRPAHYFALSIPNLNFSRPVVFAVHPGSH